MHATSRTSAASQRTAARAPGSRPRRRPLTMALILARLDARRQSRARSARRPSGGSRRWRCRARRGRVRRRHLRRSPRRAGAGRPRGRCARDRRRSTIDPETPVAAVLLDGPAWARRGTVGDGTACRSRCSAGCSAGRWSSGCGCRRGCAIPRVGRRPACRGRRRGALSLLRAARAHPPADGGDRIVQGRGRTALVGDGVGGRARLPPRRRSPLARPAARKPAGPCRDGGRRPRSCRGSRRPPGRKSVLDELPASKSARAVRRVLAVGRQGRGADPRRPAGEADRRRVRA